MPKVVISHLVSPSFTLLFFDLEFWLSIANYKKWVINWAIKGYNWRENKFKHQNGEKRQWIVNK